MVNIQHLEKRIIRVLKVTGIGWGSLGFYRGIQDYDITAKCSNTMNH